MIEVAVPTQLLEILARQQRVTELMGTLATHSLLKDYPTPPQTQEESVEETTDTLNQDLPSACARYQPKSPETLPPVKSSSRSLRTVAPAKTIPRRSQTLRRPSPNGTASSSLNALPTTRRRAPRKSLAPTYDKDPEVDAIKAFVALRSGNQLVNNQHGLEEIVSMLHAQIEFYANAVAEAYADIVSVDFGAEALLEAGLEALRAELLLLPADLSREDTKPRLVSTVKSAMLDFVHTNTVGQRLRLLPPLSSEQVQSILQRFFPETVGAPEVTDDTGENSNNYELVRQRLLWITDWHLTAAHGIAGDSRHQPLLGIKTDNKALNRRASSTASIDKEKD